MLRYPDATSKPTTLRVWTSVGPNEVVKYVLERLVETGVEQPPISAGYSAVQKILNTARMMTFDSLSKLSGNLRIFRFDREQLKYVEYSINPKKMQRDSMDGDYFKLGNEWYAIYITRYFNNKDLTSVDEYENPRHAVKYIHSILEPPFVVRDLQEHGISATKDYENYKAIQDHTCIHATPLICFIDRDLCSGHIADAMANTIQGRGFKFYGNDVFVNATDECISLGDANFTGTIQYTKRIVTFNPELYGLPDGRPEYMEIYGKTVKFYSIYIVYKVGMAQVDTDELISQYALFAHDPSYFNFRTSSVFEKEYEADPNRNLGRDLVWASSVGDIAMGFNAAIQSLGKYCRLFNLVELAKYYAIYTKVYEGYQEYPALGKMNDQSHIWTNLCSFYRSLLDTRHGDISKYKNYRATTAVTPDQYFLLFKIYVILANNHLGRRGLVRTYSHLALFEELFAVYAGLPRNHHDRPLLAVIFHHTGGFEGKQFPIDHADLAGNPVIMSLPYSIDNYKPVITYRSNEHMLQYNYSMAQYSEILDHLGVVPLDSPNLSYLYREIHNKSGATLADFRLKDFLVKNAQANINKCITHEQFPDAFEDCRADALPIISKIRKIKNPFDESDTFIYYDVDEVYEFGNILYKIDHLTGYYYRADNDWLFVFVNNGFEMIPQYFYDENDKPISYNLERDYMCGDYCESFPNRGIFV